ncbi:elongation factor G [Promicromonospora iranensis]|uniref:Ribosomal protection tetracycline resistance protein n=1 Tax=Promicromonospora iranensis TaxID=1105144 RepID=A0ABU2CUR6_9MICO|nr:TetM/TetW/TetO/TetS family tetracycline resistance ribosomal protection protein [Promicromonospora iranensis]MDR7385075.1 ribosomal protection tetracycline resistance protein [Promicromonospora iranensis]
MNPSHETAHARPDAPAGALRRCVNLGVVAHVDAGKTSLTEALLLRGGAIDRLGRVDDGTTQTDTTSQERQRGITIRAAVATFVVDGVAVNVVDTPGHPDFIAEVDRSLAVLDAAVLAVSAVEGVQAQTIVLFRALRRLGVPTVFFVNKIDRAGADPDRVLTAIARRLTPALVPLARVHHPGTPAAKAEPGDWDDPAWAEHVTARLADHDDTLLEAWIDPAQQLEQQRLRSSLSALTRSGAVHPVLFGSARTGEGVAQLIVTVTEIVPATVGDDGPGVAQVFKIERSAAGQRVCTVRMRGGTLRVRDRTLLGGGRTATVTGIEVFAPGGTAASDVTSAGQIARVRGLDTARIGDWIGTEQAAATSALPEPGLETRVVATDPAQQADLHRALADLADLDPLIAVRPDAGAARIRLYGAVQQEVLTDTLAAEYGIRVEFQETTMVCVERLAGTASAVLRMGDPGHQHHYSLGVTIEPAAPGSGVELVVAAPHITVPMHVYGNVEDYRTAVHEYLATPLAVGPHGWPVTDLRVTVVESDYPPAGPRAVAVKRTTELVVREAIRRAGTLVCEPTDRFELEAPAGTLSAVLGLLGRHGAVPGPPQVTGDLATITGTVPAAEVGALRTGLHAAAHGEGVLETVLDHYAPARNRLGVGRRPGPP